MSETDQPNLVTAKEISSLEYLQGVFPSVDTSVLLHCLRETKGELNDCVTLLLEKEKEKTKKEKEQEKLKMQELRNSLQNSQSAKLKELAFLAV
jgi:hypothetical protein